MIYSISSFLLNRFHVFLNKLQVSGTCNFQWLLSFQNTHNAPYSAYNEILLCSILIKLQPVTERDNAQGQVQKEDASNINARLNRLLTDRLE